ncbi:hypothetical protein N473_09710 [Pseudoalteromonas luteoviolacea CPMOR-1]|uniref:Uncharacterized protein n=1 Tax=Pseudoalteromonas luteoviolacea CPMOR-1 TaxID=1365248 RepID=A0A167MNC5_9GAMM|nr:hypothetical protein N473_09710 [Pseudoalteromonas luteoviolacea CPMOR-1]
MNKHDALWQVINWELSFWFFEGVNGVSCKVSCKVS